MNGRRNVTFLAAGKKLSSRRGMTLTEVLAAVALFAILTAAIVSGTNAAIRIYRRSVVFSESRTLVATLVQGISDELRYAGNIRSEAAQDGTEQVVFDSETFGPDVSLFEQDGVLRIGTEETSWELISARAYTRGLAAQAETEYADGIFTVRLTVSALALSERTTEFQVRALNP